MLKFTKFNLTGDNDVYIYSFVLDSHKFVRSFTLRLRQISCKKRKMAYPRKTFLYYIAFRRCDRCYSGHEAVQTQNKALVFCIWNTFYIISSNFVCIFCDLQILIQIIFNKSNFLRYIV